MASASDVERGQVGAGAPAPVRVLDPLPARAGRRRKRLVDARPRLDRRFLVRADDEVAGMQEPALEAARLHAGTLYGSDGTRTRDLRRDGAGSGRRRSATNRYEHLYLQAVSRSGAFIPRGFVDRLTGVWATSGPPYGDVVPVVSTGIRIGLAGSFRGVSFPRCDLRTATRRRADADLGATSAPARGSSRPTRARPRPPSRR